MERFVFLAATLLVFSNSIVYTQEPTKVEINSKSNNSLVQPTKSIDMFLENESKYSFDETIEKLIVEIEKKKWKISATHDFRKNIEKPRKKCFTN